MNIDKLQALAQALKATDEQEQQTRQSGISRRWFVRTLGMAVGAAVVGVNFRAKAGKNCPDGHGDTCNAEANYCGTNNVCTPSNVCRTSDNCQSGNTCSGSFNTCQTSNSCTGGGNSCSSDNNCDINTCTGGNKCSSNTCRVSNGCDLSNNCSSHDSTHNTCTFTG